MSSIGKSTYKLLGDFHRVSRFLQENYTLEQKNGYLVQPFFEYAHTHPMFNHSLTHRFGLWEEEGRVVAVACYEMTVGEAFLCAGRGYEHLLGEMLDHAEQQLSVEKEGKRVLHVWTTDTQQQVIDLLTDKGYTLAHEESITIYPYSRGFDRPVLPLGYTAISLEEENDFHKIHECLWKGFDHGDNPDDDVDCRMLMQSGPNFRKDLTTVVKAPDGSYACYAGMWLDEANGYAYLEPLATVPAHRKKGLAKAALMIGMEKTSKLGAKYCYGGVFEYYNHLGFENAGKRLAYKKQW